MVRLSEASIHSLLCQHASLRIVQVDLPPLGQLTGQHVLMAAGRVLHGAIVWDVRAQLAPLPTLIPTLAIERLARLPLIFSDPPGQPARPHATLVVTYTDIARLRGGYLMLRRHPITTALVREVAVTRHV